MTNINKYIQQNTIMVNFIDDKQLLIDAYTQLIDDTQDQRSREADRSHVMMGAVVGRFYERGGTAVIGRAPYGWFRYDISTNNLFSGENAIFDIPQQLEKIKREYGTSKGFWRVVSDVISSFYPLDFEKHIVYSNYCKIAYEDQNPSPALAESQRNSCNKIIDLELNITSPSNLIILTGCLCENDFHLYTQPLMDYIFKTEDSTFNGDWTPYFRDQEIWDKNKNYATEVYKTNRFTIFLSEHPQCKVIDPHVAALIKLLSKYANSMI